jgi:hypothetical protein
MTFSFALVNILSNLAYKHVLDQLDLGKGIIHKTMRLLLPQSNLPKVHVRVPTRCASLPIIGACTSFNLIETYMIHLHHVTLRYHLMQGTQVWPT